MVLTNIRQLKIRLVYMEIKSKQEEICEQLCRKLKVAYQEVENSILFDFVAKLHQDLV